MRAWALCRAKRGEDSLQRAGTRGGTGAREAASRARAAQSRRWRCARGRRVEGWACAWACARGCARARSRDGGCSDKLDRAFASAWSESAALEPPRPWKLRTRTSDSRSRDLRTTVCLVPFETRHAPNAPSTENRHDCLLIQNRAKTRRVNPPFNAEFDFDSPDPRALTRTVPFKATAKRRESEPKRGRGFAPRKRKARSTRSETRETGIVGRLPKPAPEPARRDRARGEQLHCRDASWRRNSRARLPHSLRRPTADALPLRARVRSPRFARALDARPAVRSSRDGGGARVSASQVRDARDRCGAVPRGERRGLVRRVRTRPGPVQGARRRLRRLCIHRLRLHRPRLARLGAIARTPVPRSIVTPFRARGLFVVSRRFARPDREPPPLPPPPPACRAAWCAPTPPPRSLAARTSS